MICGNHMWVGRMPFRTAVVTLLVFLALGGGMSVLSNYGGRRWQNSCEINSGIPGAWHAVDDVGGRRMKCEYEYFVGNGLM